VGRWKSNRDLTVATIRLDHELPAEKRARFENLFGQMIAIFTPTEATFFMPAIEKYPEFTATDVYRVVAEVGDRLVIRYKNPRTKVEESTIMHFEGRDRYWVDLSSTKGVISGREYFDRISDRDEKEQPNKASQPTTPAATPPHGPEARNP
jgi:hypothetical protein